MLKVLVVLSFVLVVRGVEIQFVNREIGAVWVGIQGNPGNQHLNNGGLIVGAGASVSITFTKTFKTIQYLFS